MGFKYIKDWIMRKKGHGIFMVCVEYFFRTIVVAIMPIERLSSHMWWATLVVGWSEGVFRFQIHSRCCHSLEREARMIVWGKKIVCLIQLTDSIIFIWDLTKPRSPCALCQIICVWSEFFSWDLTSSELFRFLGKSLFDSCYCCLRER